MLGSTQWRFRTPLHELVLKLDPLAPRPSSADLELSRALLFELLVLAEHGQPEVTSILCQLEEALAGGGRLDVPVAEAPLEPHALSERLAAQLGMATLRGALVIQRLHTRSEGPIDFLPDLDFEDASAAAAAEPDLTFIAVKLLDQDGDPIAGENVRIQLPDGTIKQGRTDENGEFLVDELRKGGQAKISLPDVMQPGAAEPVSLDEFVEIELLDEDGNPVPGVPYWLKDAEGTMHQGVLDEHGTAYISPIPKGECTVNFIGPPPALGVATPPAPDPDALPITPGTFIVRVVDELGEPVDGVPLSIAVAGKSNPLTTSGGIARLDDAAAGEAQLTFTDLGALRELLRARWDQTGRANSASLVAPATDTTVLALGQSLDAFPIAPAQMQTFSLRPKVIRARLFGQFFDTAKAFLLPSALPSLQELTEIYAEHPASTVLIVGHTDTQGKPDFNDPLSLERANNMAAYLRDDVDAWLAFYDDGVDPIKRWGAHEDGLMMSSLPDKDELFKHGTPIHDYQKSRGLTVDGSAGPETRRSLIGEYMGLDGTTLPSDIQVVTHGCGENFPDDPEPDGTADQLNRDVELFFFDDGLGVQPPPLGTNSGPDALDYPEWRARARETRNFKAIPGVTTVTAARVPMRFSNRKSFPKPSALPMLTVLGQALARDPTQILVLIGNADATGTDDANFHISLERAKATRAWLLKDRDFFLKQFKLQDEKQRWDWEEVQWMLYTARPGGAPCYVGIADGFPGERTVNALGAFQLATDGLNATYAADQETLEKLVDVYLAALNIPPLPADRVRVVGGGSWTTPQPFGQSPAPDLPDHSPDLRRVEAFFFDQEPTPPVGSFPTKRSPEPTVYTQWASQATTELSATPDPLVLRAYDPNSGALDQRSLLIARVDADTGTVAVGTLTTDAQGTISAPLPNGNYFAQTNVQGNATAITFLIDPDEICGAALAFEDIGGLEALSIG